MRPIDSVCGDNQKAACTARSAQRDIGAGDGDENVTFRSALGDRG